jgi:hypothetical protein
MPSPCGARCAAAARFRAEEEQRAHDNCLENLEMVASALLQEQVDVTEGAWRCKVLLEILDPA